MLTNNATDRGATRKGDRAENARLLAYCAAMGDYRQYCADHGARVNEEFFKANPYTAPDNKGR